MAKVNKEFFVEGIPSELSLFELPPSQTGVENIKMENVPSTSTISENSPIFFEISGQNGMEYLDLMNVKMRVKHENGTKLAAGEDVAPVNVFLQSLFSQIDVSIQGKVLLSTSGYYPYKAYIQTLLKYSQLTTQIWLKDTTNEFDDMDFSNGDNTNGIVRMAYIEESKVLDLQGPILHDLFQVKRYILNQVGISIKFHRSRSDFCLLSNEAKKYKNDVEEIVLRVCKAQVNPAVITAHNAMPSSNNAKYPYTKTEIASMTLAKGMSNFSWNQVFQDTCPKRIIVTFVCSEATSGSSLTKNPWNFQNHNLSQISVSVDGVPVNGGPMQISYDATNGYTVTRVLTNLLESTKKWLNDEGMNLSRDDIAGDFALYAFDTQPDVDGNEYLSFKKQENVRIGDHFNTALPHTVNCIVLVERQGYFKNSQSRDIVID